MTSDDGPGDATDGLDSPGRGRDADKRTLELVRAVGRVAARATSLTELWGGVCEVCVESGPYVFAWVGEHDAGTDEIVPAASYGHEDGYLDAVDVPTDEEARRGPATHAVESGTVAVVDDIADDPGFEPWREDALARGYRSGGAVPIVHEGTVRGILAVYADEPGAVDEFGRDVLAELGETVGLATAAIERRRALVADAVLEVDLAVADHPFVDVCVATGSELAVEGIVAVSGDEHVFYLGVDGDTAAVVAAVESALDGVRRVRVVDGAEPDEPIRTATRDPDSDEAADRTTDTGGSLIEVVDAAPALTDGLGTHGGTVTAVSVDADRLEATVEFPPGTDIRRVLADLPFDATLLAQRTTERPALPERTFETRVTERLTDRQQAALRAAYHAGYHDRPRASDGDDVAETLGVSPSTFHQHHRVGISKLLAAAFDRRDPEDGAIPD